MSRSLPILLLCGCLTLPALSQTEPDSALWTLLLEDVVVTAQYAPTSSRNALHDIRRLDRELIERRGANNLEQLLSQETNIRLRQDLILGSSLSLLGVDGQNVKIMIDGVPVIGRQNGNIDLGQLNLNNIERVEIVEGPLSVSYGTDALAGVINLITKKSQLDRHEAGVMTQWESRGENSLTAHLGARLTDRLLLRVDAGRDNFDGFGPDSLRALPWNPKEQWYGETSLLYDLGGDRRLRYALRYFDEEVSNLGAVRRPQFKPYAFDDFFRTRRIDHTLTFEGDISPTHYLQLTGGYNRFLRRKNTFRFNFDEEEQEEVAGQQDTSRFETLMARLTLARRATNTAFQYQFGLDLRHDQALGQRIRDPLSNRDRYSQIGDYALFGSLRYRPADPLTVEAGLRYAYNTRYDAPLIPSLNARFELGEQWTLRASYGRGFRSPDLKELFFEFIDINHFILGNPDLNAERSDNVQVGLTFRREDNGQQLQAGLKGFFNHFRDKIELFEFVETPEGIRPAVDTSTLRFAYFNQAIYKNQGLLLDARYRRGPWSLNGGVSFIGYYHPLSEEVPAVPTFTYVWEWSGELSYHLTKHQTTVSVFARGNDRLVSYFPTTDENGGETAGQRLQQGFTQLEATLSKFFWKKRLHLTAGARNLLDVQNVNVSGNGGGGAHSGSAGAAPVSPGRSYFLRANLQLNW